MVARVNYFLARGKFILGPFLAFFGCPPIWVFFTFFPFHTRRTPHDGLFVLSLVSGVEKKWRFSFFWEISKMAIFGQNWPKFGLNLAISGYIRTEAWVFKKICSSKILKIFLIFFSKSKKKTISGEKNPHFVLMNTVMTPLSLRKKLKWLKQSFLVSRRLAEKRPKESRPFVRPFVRS